MKKLFTLLALIVLTTINAQAPQGFNYQATVRNNSGQLLLNQIVLVKFNILQNSATGTLVYSENQNANTDDLGHIALMVGQGTATTGTFSTINWANGSYYLGIELNTGSGYVAMGTTQLLSVPYALYANSAGNSQSQGKTSIILTGNITNAQAAAKIATELGANTENIYIQNTTQLTTVNLSSITNAVTISVKDNLNLQSVNLSGLTNSFGDLSFINNSSLSSILLTSLNYCYQFYIYNSLITNLSFPALNKCYSFSIFGNNLLTSVSFPALNKCYSLSISENNLLTSVSFPILTSSDIGIDANPSLTNLSFPNLITCKNFSSFGNSLTVNSVNTILNKLVTVSPSSGKSIFLSEQNPPAPPTGQGIIDKQTLINAGNTVSTD